MITSGPFSLSNGVAQLVPDPGSKLGYSSANVQVQNSSPFILSVTANGQQYTIQDFTAQTIPLSMDGTAITILPSSGPAGTQGNVEVVWLLASETAPMSDGQLTGAAQYAVGLGSIVPATFTHVSGVDWNATHIAVPPTTRTLFFSLSTVGDLPTMWVQGDRSSYYYRFGPLYLAGAGTFSYIAVVPVNAILDPTVTIQIASTTGLVACEIVGDTALTDESAFYNGVAQTIQTSSGTLLTGPARVLTVMMDSTASAASMAFDGGTILVANTESKELAFPPNTILTAAQSITVSGSLAVAAATYCYP